MTSLKGFRLVSLEVVEKFVTVRDNFSIIYIDFWRVLKTLKIGYRDPVVGLPRQLGGRHGLDGAALRGVLRQLGDRPILPRPPESLEERGQLLPLFQKAKGWVSISCDQDR